MPKPAPTFFAVYVELPHETPILARVDRTAVAVLGGALLGMPEETAIERSNQTPKDEPIWDAMGEILNISSSALSTQGRVVYKSVSLEANKIPAFAQGVLAKPTAISTYRLAINSKPHGLFTLFS